MKRKLLFSFLFFLSSFSIDLLAFAPPANDACVEVIEKQLTRNVASIYKIDSPSNSSIANLPLFPSNDMDTTYSAGICQITKLLATDGVASANFSRDVSIYGNIAAVAKLNTTTDETGAVYIFENQDGNWEQTAKLTTSDENENDSFGRSVSLYGNFLLVGANKSYINGWYSGAAYIFEKKENGWEQIAELTASDASYNQYFGIGVHLDEDVLIIGSTKNGNGAAYIFEKPVNGWTTMTETAKLVASDGVEGDVFGGSVSLDNNVAVVGAYQYENNGVRTGTAYIFERPIGGWGNSTETAKLLSSDGASGDNFGYKVDIDENIIIISAYGKETYTGAVYVYERPLSGWVDMLENHKLVASDASIVDYFGEGLSISNGAILIGARESGPNGTAYLYTKVDGIWQEFEKYSVTDGNTDKLFAKNVSIADNKMILSAPSDDETGNYSGAAYIFEKAICDLSIEDIIIQDEICPGGTDNIVSIIANCTNCVGGLEYSIDGTDFSNTSGVFENLDAGIYTVTVRNPNEPCCFVAHELQVSPLNERHVLTAGDKGNSENFGSRLCFSGDFLVVGTPRNDNLRGAAYVFKKQWNGWQQVAKLTRQVRGNGGSFGESVSMDGDLIIVGATGVDANDYVSGAAYIFEKPTDGWKDMTQTAKLIASDGAYYDSFGRSVAIKGTSVLVGAPNHDSNASSSGTVYVFERPEGGWIDAQENAQLLPDEITVLDYFGTSIDIYNNFAVIGAAASSSLDRAIYVYEKQMNEWIAIARLTISDVTGGGGFGSRIAIYDDMIIAGASGDDVNGEYSGSAYLFNKPIGGWEDMTESYKITPSNGYKNEFFGSRVTVSENLIAISAPKRRGEYLSAGAVYVYELPTDGWGDTAPNETFILTASDAYAHEQFGAGLESDGINIAIGIPFKHIEGYDEGAIYIFEGCNGGKCDGNNLVIDTDNTSSVLPNDEYWAKSTLSSDISLSDVADISYKAGLNITLKEGFHVPKGANFSAIIEQCQNVEDNLSSPNPQLSSRVTNQVSKDLTILPNPFLSFTNLKYTLEKTTAVNLQIYNMGGQLVQELVTSETQQAGVYEYTFEPKGDTGNVYFAVMTTPEQVITKKMIFIR